MKPWIKRTLIAVLGLGAFVGGLSAWAHHEYRNHFSQLNAEDVVRWRAKAIERGGRELQLDETQKQRLGQLFDRVNEQRLALVPDGADPRATLQQLVAGERFDRERASTLLAEKSDAVRGKGPEVINAAADFFDSLRPEQQAKVRDFMNRHHAKRS
jgi:Spy/CpxP family protein refolding chaperone